MLRFFVTLFCLGGLAGCSPPDVPKTPQEAATQLESLGTTVIKIGQTAQSTQNATQSVISEQVEAVQDGVDTTKEVLTSVGTTVENGATQVKDGLESIGTTVIQVFN